MKAMLGVASGCREEGGSRQKRTGREPVIKRPGLCCGVHEFNKTAKGAACAAPGPRAAKRIG